MGDLRSHGLLDLGLDLHPPRVGSTKTLAQNKADGALDVVSLLQCALRFGDDIPSSGDAQTTCP